eukprot:UN03403
MSHESFNDAFARNHSNLGPGNTFSWNGGSYTTDRADGLDMSGGFGYSSSYSSFSTHKTSCMSCMGSGHKDCYSCSGNGRKSCHSCDGDGSKDCYKCDGRGRCEVLCTGCPSCGSSSKKKCYWCGNLAVAAFNIFAGIKGATDLSSCNNNCDHGYVTCNRCNDAPCGYYEEKECSPCHGSRKKGCWTCNGSGYESCDSFHCDGGKKKCSSCGGP